MSTCEAIRWAQKKHPTIGMNGFSTRELSYNAREFLNDPGATAQVETAIAFLYQLQKTKGVGERAPGAYYLKHVAENWGRLNGLSPYVSNGALIIAALHLGFSVKQWENSPNAGIGISRRKLEQIVDYINASRGHG